MIKNIGDILKEKAPDLFARTKLTRKDPSYINQNQAFELYRSRRNQESKAKVSTKTYAEENLLTTEKNATPQTLIEIISASITAEGHLDPRDFHKASNLLPIVEHMIDDLETEIKQMGILTGNAVYGPMMLGILCEYISMRDKLNSIGFDSTKISITLNEIAKNSNFIKVKEKASVFACKLA